MSTRAKKISNGTPSAPKRRGKRLISITVILIVVLVILGIGTLLGASIYFSNSILQVPDYTTPTYNTLVLAVSDMTVTLQRMGDDLHPGEFEIEWPAGQALVGPTLSLDRNSVTRQLLLKTGQLSVGTYVFWTRYVYTGQIRNSLGLSMSTVQVPDPLGMMPAWYVPGKLSKWAILVHGRGSTREEALACHCFLSPIVTLLAPRTVQITRSTWAIASGRIWRLPSSTRWLMARSMSYSMAGRRVVLLSKSLCINQVWPTWYRRWCSMLPFLTGPLHSNTRRRGCRYLVTWSTLPSL